MSNQKVTFIKARVTEDGRNTYATVRVHEEKDHPILGKVPFAYNGIVQLSTELCKVEDNGNKLTINDLVLAKEEGKPGPEIEGLQVAKTGETLPRIEGNDGVMHKLEILV